MTEGVTRELLYFFARFLAKVPHARPLHTVGGLGLLLMWPAVGDGTTLWRSEGLDPQQEASTHLPDSYVFVRSVYIFCVSFLPYLFGSLHTSTFVVSCNINIAVAVAPSFMHVIAEAVLLRRPRLAESEWGMAIIHCRAEPSLGSARRKPG